MAEEFGKLEKIRSTISMMIQLISSYIENGEQDFQ